MNFNAQKGRKHRQKNMQQQQKNYDKLEIFKMRGEEKEEEELNMKFVFRIAHC